MPVHPFDYKYQNNFYSFDEIKSIYDESSRIQRWLDFESALAKAQAKFGIIKQEYADIISSNCDISKWSEEELIKAYHNAKNSITPTLKLLRSKCGKAKDYVHHGATTQDVVDTGEVLALKSILSIVEKDTVALCKVLCELSEKNKKVPIIGRSHGQHALPITFGYKVALWLSEIDRHLYRINRARNTCLFGQLGGAVGTFSVLEQPENVKRDVMEQLGLGFELHSWHTSRDRIVEISNSVAMLAETCGKIANEVFTLSCSEFSELSENKVNSGKSSTMPHKVNPVICQRIIVCVSQVRGQIPIIYQAMGASHERDPRQLWSEWISVPNLMIYAATALRNTLTIINNIEIHSDKMLDNIYKFKDLICSEMLTFYLTPKLGKETSQEIISNL